MAYESHCDCQLKFKSLDFCFNQTVVTPLFHSENVGKTQISHMNTLAQFHIICAPEKIHQYDAENNFKNCVFIVKKKYNIFISVTAYSTVSPSSSSYFYEQLNISCSRATTWMSARHRQRIKAGPQGMLWGRRDLAEIFA